MEQDLRRECDHLKELLEKKEKEILGKNRIIKHGVMWLNREKDWSGKSSPKISYRKTKEILAKVGINVDQ